MGLLFDRKTIAGSTIGGIKSTKRMLEFCAKHEILPDFTLVEAKDIDRVWGLLQQSNADG